MKPTKTMKKKKPKPTCPRCGSIGSGIYKRWVLNSQKNRYEPYYYFAHKYKKEDGKWSIKWCYLGRSIREISEAEDEEHVEAKPFEVFKAKAKPKASIMAKVKGLLKRRK